jgi:hypothetical protein
VSEHLGFPGDSCTLCGAIGLPFGFDLETATCVRCIMAFGALVTPNPFSQVVGSLMVASWTRNDLRFVWGVRDAAMAALMETSDPARIKLLWRLYLVAAIVNRRFVPHVSRSEPIAFVNDGH